MIETWFGSLTKEMIELIMIVFLIGIAGGSFSLGIVTKLFSAEGKIKFTPGYVLYAIILAPLIEEVIFRGPIWYFFGEFSLGSWLLIIVWGGIIFGLIHGFVGKEDGWDILPNNAYRVRSIIGATFYGILLGWLVVTTDSLLAAMVLHGLFNIFSICFTAIIRSFSRN